MIIRFGVTLVTCFGFKMILIIHCEVHEIISLLSLLPYSLLLHFYFYG